MKDLSLKENSSHGTFLFPLKCYEQTGKVGQVIIPYHWHDQVEWIYLTKGELSVGIDMNTHTITKGTILCIQPTELHQIVCQKDCHYYAIVFPLDWLSFRHFDYCENNYIAPLMQGKLMLPRMFDTTAAYGKRILNEYKELLSAYHGESEGRFFIIKASLLKIISILISNDLFAANDTSNKKAVTEKIKLIKQALTYMQDHYEQKIYIDDIAKEVGLNPQYFCRFFKSVIGSTPIEYLNHYRIETATLLLRTSDNKILEVCYLSGFENFSYFIKTFKKHVGYTPSDYRAQYMNT